MSAFANHLSDGSPLLMLFPVFSDADFDVLAGVIWLSSVLYEELEAFVFLFEQMDFFLQVSDYLHLSLVRVFHNGYFHLSVSIALRHSFSASRALMRSCRALTL